jgi:general secretion pathway protein D
VVKSGDTVMLAGLITESASQGTSGFPGLSRIPVIGGLFGRRTSFKDRSEIIILVTPTLVRDTSAAAKFTDDYARRFRAMDPITQPNPAAPGTAAPAPAPATESPERKP